MKRNETKTATQKTPTRDAKPPDGPFSEGEIRLRAGYLTNSTKLAVRLLMTFGESIAQGSTGYPGSGQALATLQRHGYVTEWIDGRRYLTDGGKQMQAYLLASTPTSALPSAPPNAKHAPEVPPKPETPPLPSVPEAHQGPTAILHGFDPEWIARMKRVAKAYRKTLEEAIILAGDDFYLLRRHGIDAEPA